jgi:hypothetical protein
MSAPDDSYRTAPTSELIDDLLDNRPEGLSKGQGGIAGAAHKHEKRTPRCIGRDGSRALQAQVTD